MLVSRVLRQYFGALTLVLGSLVPVWLSEIEVAGPALWRAASAFLLVLVLAHLFFVVYLPLRTLGVRSLLVINMPVTYFAYGLVAAALGLLVINLVGVPTPDFGLYYAALLAALAAVFFAFADVVVIEDNETS